MEAQCLQGVLDGEDEEVRKRMRSIKNCLAAKKSREQARSYIQKLESKMAALEQQNADLAWRLAKTEAENAVIAQFRKRHVSPSGGHGTPVIAPSAPGFWGSASHYRHRTWAQGDTPYNRHLFPDTSPPASSSSPRSGSLSSSEGASDLDESLFDVFEPLVPVEHEKSLSPPDASTPFKQPTEGETAEETQRCPAWALGDGDGELSEFLLSDSLGAQDVLAEWGL